MIKHILDIRIVLIWSTCNTTNIFTGAKIKKIRYTFGFHRYVTYQYSKIAAGIKLKPILNRYTSKNRFLRRSSITTGDSPFKLAGWNIYSLLPSILIDSLTPSFPFLTFSTFICDSSTDWMGNFSIAGVPTWIRSLSSS